MGKSKSKAATQAKSKQISQPPSEPNPPKEMWATWERKVERLHSKTYTQIKNGWLSHIPQIGTPGSPPREGLDSIDALVSLFPRVKRQGDIVERISGARPSVLHEALYWAHKAVHVEISCAEAIVAGRHTWAIVDAYQASLFALASILAFLGFSVARHDNNFILIDVWANNPSSNNKKLLLDIVSDETYQLIRFQTFGHFHKWAILKRVLRTLKIDAGHEGLSKLVVLINDGLKPHDDKSFALHRNSVNYQSKVWLSNDLIKNDPSGPIKPAQSPQEIYNEIFNGSPTGTIYLMCALIELACRFARNLESSKIIKQEVGTLARRNSALKIICNFDWESHFSD